MIQLAQHFRDHPTKRHSEWLRQRQWFIKAKEQQEKREQAADRAEEELFAMAADVVLASNAQIAEFEARLDGYDARLNAYEAKLDVYDAAVAQALMESVERLARLEEEHRRLVERGFTAPNGQKVFKSEDGTFVVDQAGQLVGEDVITPPQIPDGLPTAEQVRGIVAGIDAEKDHQRELHQAQKDIDEAREKLSTARETLEEGRELAGKDGLTVREIEDFEAEMDAAMPSSLPTLPTSAMKIVSGLNETNAPSAQKTFTGAARENALPNMPLPTSAPNALALDG